MEKWKNFIFFSNSTNIIVWAVHANLSVEPEVAINTYHYHMHNDSTTVTCRHHWLIWSVYRTCLWFQKHSGNWPCWCLISMFYQLPCAMHAAISNADSVPCSITLYLQWYTKDNILSKCVTSLLRFWCQLPANAQSRLYTRISISVTVIRPWTIIRTHRTVLLCVSKEG